MMKKIFLMMALALVALCGCKSDKKTSDEANQMIKAASKSKDYQRLLLLTDSLEKAGDIVPATANYWRGYACERMKRKDEAVSYWRSVVDSGEQLRQEEELASYAKSASRLVNQLCLNGDYQGALQTALPVTSRLESLACDTTSDYVNLLIYIGLCQLVVDNHSDVQSSSLLSAIDKHRENIARKRSDEAYKDAIAGLVNIIYYCAKAGKPKEALFYTNSFGGLLMEYEERPGVDTNYVDRQAGRYTIYKAWALKQLGRTKEAKEAFETFLQTRYSKEPEGMAVAADYQSDTGETEYSSDL